jgi:septal ring factor EnvC (AmiA/AmiB activator)
MLSRQRLESLWGTRCARNRMQLAALFTVVPGFSSHMTQAQEPDRLAITQQIHQLTDSMIRAQAQIEETQRQLNAMKEQLAALEQRAYVSATPPLTNKATTASNP